MSNGQLASDRGDIRQVRTTCRSCYAGCGLVVTIDENERVLKAEGDREHPFSRGYSCGKGRSIPELHHSDTRLLSPRANGREVTWDEAISDLGKRLNAIQETHGGKTIGTFMGTGGAYDMLSLMPFMKLAPMLRSPQKYSTGTVDVAPIWRATQMVTGFHLMVPNWLPEQPGPSLAIVMGVNLCVSHGYMGSNGSNAVQRLRNYRQDGGEVWTVDPRRTKTALNSDRHLAPRPGSDPYLLAWLLREILEDGADEAELEAHCSPNDVEALRAAVQPFTLARAVAQTGLQAEDLNDLLAAVRLHRQVAIISGSGLGFTPNGLIGEWLRLAILVVTGSLDRKDQRGMFFDPNNMSRMELGSWSDPAPEEGAQLGAPQSRPELQSFYGDYPCAALVDEIEAGNLRALVVMGGNPLIALPEPARVKAALAKLDVLVTLDPFDTELARMATHALPVEWQLERSDVRQVPGRIQYAEAAVAPLGDTKRAWWILGAIGELLGVDLFGDGLSLDERTDEAYWRIMLSNGRFSFDELVAAGTEGLTTPRLDGWFHERVLKDRGWRIAPASLIERLRNLEDAPAGDALLVAGRVDFACNSMLYPSANRREEIPPAIHISADLSRARAIGDGDMIRISTGAGQLEGAARIDDNLRPGTVWMNHGWSKRNVNSLLDSKDIDELTIQPYMSAIPVNLEKIK